MVTVSEEDCVAVAFNSLTHSLDDCRQLIESNDTLIGFPIYCRRRRLEQEDTGTMYSPTTPPTQ